MGRLQDALATWRDYIVDGVSSSGLYNPDKKAIRAYEAEINAALDALAAGQGAGSFAFDTLANLTTVVVAPVNAAAFVFSDSTSANNGIYRNTGTALAAVWTKVSGLIWGNIAPLAIGSVTFGMPLSASITGPVTAPVLNLTMPAPATGSFALPQAYASGIAAQATAPATCVVYSGSTYVCMIAHTTTSTFDPTKWLLIAAQGLTGPAPWAAPAAWASSTAYSATAPAALVTYNNQTYVCTVAHTSGGSFDATKFTLVAAQGVTGPAPWAAPAAWASSTAYSASAPSALVTYAGNTYVCTVSHTSGGSFDGAKFVQVAGQGAAGAAGAAWSYVPASGGSVKAANAAALPSFTYSAGVMTAAANGAFPSIDGVALSIGDRFWHWDYTGANGGNVAFGIYTLTNAGSVSTQWTATRAADANSAASLALINAYVAGGTANKGLSLAVTQAVGAITLGTTAIVVTVVAAPATVAANIANLEYAQPFMAGALAAFQSVRRLQLFGANTAKFYTIHYLFWNDAGTRFNCTVQQCDDASGTNAVDVASFTSNGVTYAGLTEFTLAAVGGSGVTGTLVVDLTGLSSIAVNTAPSSAADFKARLISPKCLFDSTAIAASIAARIQAPIDASLLLIPGSKKPFADACTNTFIRGLIPSLFVYGCDATHTYIVDYIEVSIFGGFSRARVTIKDITSGTEVCTWSTQTAGAIAFAPFIASLPSTIKLLQGSLASYSGVYAVLSINWSALAAAATYNYTTVAQAGIHPDLCYTPEQTADYIDRDYWHEIVRVGATQTYTTLRAAVESVQIDPTIPNVQCNRSHYHHRILIDLVDPGTYNATNLTIPEFVDVRGLGPTQTTILRENTNAYPQFQWNFDGKFMDCTIQSDSNQYCLHSDDFNRISQSGGASQNRWLRQKVKRVNLVGGAAQDAWLFGCGISSGETIRFEDVDACHLNPASTAQAAFGFHNSGPTLGTPSLAASTKPAHIEMIGCRSTDPTMYSVHLQSIDPATVSRLTLIGCDFHCVRNDIATGEVVTDLAAARFGWEIGGVHAGPIYQFDPDGAYVLATTAGVAVSGTAAALIFGAIDELGRGAKWVKDGSANSLGARLGDCSSVNKTLTIGAQTCTFTTNLTAASNATVIGLINAACSTNPVSTVDISLESYPDMGFTRLMSNATGATIPKGRFITRTGANTIALANPGDPIFGWTYRDILNGLAGKVVTTRKVHQAYIGNAASSSGKWGITSNGQLDFSASTKIGDVTGGIVAVW